MLQFVVLIFKQDIFAPNTDSRFSIDSTGHEISSFKKLLLHDFVETGLFVSTWLAFPEKLARTELSEVFSCLGTDVLKQFQADPSYPLLVRMEIQKDHWVILRPEDSGHSIFKYMRYVSDHRNHLLSLSCYFLKFTRSYFLF